MEKILQFPKLFLSPFLVFLCFALIGCAETPKGFLKLSEGCLEKRQLQMRQYDTKDEEKIIISVAGVLQDIGFTLDESESRLGLVAASKKADATNPAQVTGAIIIDILSVLAAGLSGTMPGASATANIDSVQHVKASVVVKPSLDGCKTIVRATFQRIVWNAQNQINRVETISEPEIYQIFFKNLSKSIFLEAHKI